MQHDFILLDRSMSMSEGSKWIEALASVNLYVKKLAEDKVDTGVTLVTFDQPSTGKLAFEVIRDRVIPSTWKEVTNNDASPRGNTPLNDAIGRIVHLANEGVPGGLHAYEKVAIIIVTDGEENASVEISHAQAKALLDSCRQKGWQVIFLGANYDNMTQASGYGTLSGQTVSSSTRNMKASMAFMASKRGAYGSGTARSMDFSEEEKAELKK